MENTQNFNVDEALAKLDRINSQLSSGKIDLNESLELYKEGVLLAEACRQHLEGVEQTLKVLTPTQG